MPGISDDLIARVETEARDKTGTLNLGGISGIRNLPIDLFNLTHLRTLAIPSLGLRELPFEIAALENLEELDVSFNSITSIPRQLEDLPKLTSINLSGNNLKELPNFFLRMGKLRVVKVGYNPFSKFPKSLFDLPNLIDLDVSGISSVRLPEPTEDLSITRLGIGGYNLRNLPKWVTRLKGLTSLAAHDNEFGRIPDEVLSFEDLQTLNLGANAIDELDPNIANLIKLKVLALFANRLNRLPSSFGNLINLQRLMLQNNNFSEFPDVLLKFDKIEDISFENYDFWDKSKGKGQNRIRSVPHQITRLKRLSHLGLRKNPVETPPLEVAERGVESVFEYFRQIDEVGQDFLYEAKLLIVGEGGAGKTTLANKIIDHRYKLDSSEKSTEGIAVKKWSFQKKDRKKARDVSVNIWDFGGQEIYHATHQFFLTKRSLYILVADDRKEDTDFYYWLNIIELLSDSSPVIIVKNEKQDRSREIDERQLRMRFKNLVAVAATNLATNRGLGDLASLIRRQISTLPHIGQPLPKNWVSVRKRLEENQANYIRIEEYYAVCSEYGLSESKDNSKLVEYLHDLGVCLHFERDPLLKNILILKPKWGTDAVYRVLDNKAVIAALGRFDRAELKSIWSDAQYTDMVDQLLQLMLNFKLCYRIPEAEDAYIAPQLLGLNQPQYAWQHENDLVMRYKYDFMPKGIMTRMIVAMQAFIAETKLVWKTGVVLERDGARAELIEHLDLRQMRIRAGGATKKELMTIVIYELEKIHSTFNQLKVQALIPCSCSVCSGLQSPYFFALETLKKSMAGGQRAIQCHESFEMVPVARLIDDVRAMAAPALGGGAEGAGVIITGTVGTLIMQGGRPVEEDRSGRRRAGSAWANGTFYLLVLVVVIGGIGYFAQVVPAYTMVLLIVAGVLLVPIVGALQLKNDERLSEKSFVELMRLAIGQLPLLSKLAKTTDDGENSRKKSGGRKDRAD